MPAEPDFIALRRKMVDNQVRTTDVTDHPLIDKLLETPREIFVPTNLRPLAYLDQDIALSDGGASQRYLIAPSPFARLVQLAAIKPDDLVLDIGGATGYSSAILSRLASAVIMLEVDDSLAGKANANLSALGCDNAVVVTGPLEKGYPKEGPYDVIFIGGSVEVLPPSLFAQLKDGGALVCVQGRGGAGQAMRFIKNAGTVSGRKTFNCPAKPIPGFEKALEFQF